MPHLSLDHWIVALSEAAVAAARVGVLVTFVVCCGRAASGSGSLIHWIRVTSDLTRRSGAQVINETLEPSGSDHREFLEGETKLTDATLVVGVIGLAAWSQLFVSSDQTPASQLSAMTLGLLFAGSAVLLTGTLVWRGIGLYVTNLGRQLTLEVGFSFIGFGLASIVADLRGWVLGTVVAAASALIATRSLVDYGMTASILRKLNLSAPISTGASLGGAQGTVPPTTEPNSSRAAGPPASLPLPGSSSESDQGQAHRDPPPPSTSL